MSLAGKTLFITGGSRGIGLAIALRAARDGANIAIAAKTADPNPKLEGTIYSAADAIERAGGHALPLMSNANAVSAAMVRQPGYDPVSHRSARGAISTQACSPPVLAASRRRPTCWHARGQAS